MAAVDPIPLGDGRLPIMVASHERSGTHFLMNSLAACFDYVSNPWVDIDRPLFNINYYHPQSLRTLIVKLAALRTANILKCHYEYEFFAPIADAFAGTIQVFYIYRNPADAMVSYWRFLHTWNWVEGPKLATALDFGTAPPMGRLMRFQMRQYDSMLDRWANHVRCWLQAPAAVHFVKYEDLAQRYEDTVQNLGVSLGLAPRRIVRPSREHSVVQQGDINFVPPAAADNSQAVAELALAKFPDLMARLGYS